MEEKNVREVKGAHDVEICYVHRMHIVCTQLMNDLKKNDTPVVE